MVRESAVVDTGLQNLVAGLDSQADLHGLIVKRL